jgi:hypothetical protein
MYTQLHNVVVLEISQPFVVVVNKPCEQDMYAFVGLG